MILENSLLTGYECNRVSQRRPIDPRKANCLSVILSHARLPNQCCCPGNTFVNSGSPVKNDQNQQTCLKIKTASIFE